MSQDNDQASTQQQKTTDVVFSINKLYTKDISFETPNSPQVFQEEWKPDMDIQIGNQAHAFENDIHEVILTLTVTAKLGKKTAFLAEVRQAGLFQIKGVEKQELSRLVGAYCPNILFPYARETVNSLTIKGGFPSFVLAPVNFEVLYQQHVDSLQNKKTVTEAKH